MTGRRRPRWSSHCLVVALLFAGFGGCDRERVEPANGAAAADATEAVASRVFGDGVASGQAVVEGDGWVLTAADVAAYLDLFPTLTLDQALEDLVELYAVSELVTADDERLVPYAERDGRVRGLVSSYLRGAIWSDEDFSEPEAARVEELMESPEVYEELFVPELTRVSHLLVRQSEADGASDDEDGEDASEDARDQQAAVGATAELQRLARRAMERLERREGSLYADDLDAVADALREEIGERPIEIRVEKHFAFPREYAGPVRWPAGEAAVAEEFAEAAFSADVGEVTGPVQTDFGWHVILVENRIPEEPPSPGEIRAWVENLVLAEQYTDATNQAIARLGERARIIPHLENMTIVSQDFLERAQRSESMRSARFR